MKRNLYIIRAWNGSGGGIGTYHVVATGVNAAKRAVREREPVAKRVQCIEERQVIVVEPEPEVCEYSGLPGLKSYCEK